MFGLLYKGVKTGIAIRDQLTAKKILKFLFEIKDVSIEKRRDFAIELGQYEGSRQTAGETILILLDKLDHLFKPQIIGKLAKAKNLEKITVDNFYDYLMLYKEFLCMIYRNYTIFSHARNLMVKMSFIV